MKVFGKIVLAFACIALAFGACALRLNGAVFVSPDENAAHFFAATEAATGRLFSVEPLNGPLRDALHPRSVLSLSGRLVPASFLGLPALAGAVASVVGAWSIPFTPIALSVLAVIAWAFLCRRAFGERLGWLAGALLALLPAWWYYTARSLMPNVPFAAFVIFAAFFLVVRPFKNLRPATSLERLMPWLDGALAGACLGLALFIRFSEIAWVLIGLAFLAWTFHRALDRKTVIGFVLACALALTPMFVLQRQLYGSPWSNGYVAAEDASGGGDVGVAVPASVPSGPAWWNRAEAALAPMFPFGLHPRLAWRQFVAYGLGMFWWEFALAAVGLWALGSGHWRAKKESDRQHPEASAQRPALSAYALVALVVSLWLILMYGSWTFTDNPDPTQITIGNSHVRYWLPIFVLLTPFAAAAFDRLARFAKRAAAQNVILAACVLAWGALGFNAAFLAPQDGLFAEAAVLAQSAAIRDGVAKLTEKNAIIVVDRADKFLFPLRRVVYPLRSDKTYALLPQAAAEVPLYYYGITFPPADLAYLNGDKLKALGLAINPVQVFGIETLYEIKVIE